MLTYDSLCTSVCRTLLFILITGLHLIQPNSWVACQIKGYIIRDQITLVINYYDKTIVSFFFKKKKKKENNLFYYPSRRNNIYYHQE